MSSERRPTSKVAASFAWAEPFLTVTARSASPRRVASGTTTSHLQWPSSSLTWVRVCVELSRYVTKPSQSAPSGTSVSTRRPSPARTDAGRLRSDAERVRLGGSDSSPESRSHNRHRQEHRRQRNGNRQRNGTDLPHGRPQTNDRGLGAVQRVQSRSALDGRTGDSPFPMRQSGGRRGACGDSVMTRHSAQFCAPDFCQCEAGTARRP